MNVYLYPMLSQLLKKKIHETYIFRPFFGSCLDSWCFCCSGKKWIHLPVARNVEVIMSVMSLVIPEHMADVLDEWGAVSLILEKIILGISELVVFFSGFWKMFFCLFFETC